MKTKKMILYPDVVYARKSFKGVKKVTVPSQSMSLAEILRRFIRKESLPIEKEGVYETRFGDLEKLQREDITVKADRIEEISNAVKSHNKREADKKAKQQKELEEKAAGAVAPPVGVPPDKPTT